MLGAVIGIVKLELDVAWLVGCSGLVFLMQPGFMCLESGLTRSKNSINVAIKNLTDFAISVMVFWVFGFAVMFGATQWGWIGTSHFWPELADSSRLAAFFLFQAMFCGTATTIVSGAVSERVRYSLYLWVCLMISGLIYPMFGHWAWNGIENLGAGAGSIGWLQTLGFSDFAGSTVVHSVGGWVALAALLVVGPRTGRYGPDGQSHQINGSDVPLSVLGCMLLWLGWMGFNGGSTLSFDDQIPRVIVQTILAGATGLLSAGALGWYYTKMPQVETMINGSLAGLVSITAGCNAVSTPRAALIGAIGGAVMVLATYWLNRWHVDDGVDAVAIHGACGAWGTISVALFGELEILNTGLTRYQQLGVQLIGVAVCFAWAFGVSYLILRIINRITPLRVTVEEEELGLNVSEHGAKTEVYDLFRVMDEQARTQDFSLRVPEQPYTEVGKIARRYNQVMARVDDYAQQLKRFNAQLEQLVEERTEELSRANAELIRMDSVKDQFLANTSHEIRTPLNGMIGLAESMLDGIAGPISMDQEENLSLIAQSGRRLSNLVNDILDFSQLRHDRIELQLRPVRLRTMVDLIVTLSQASLPSKKKLEIVNGIPMDLPLVYADASRLQQILYNLIGNAIKFTPQGSVTLLARLLDEPDDQSAEDGETAGQVQITIADTGIGIAQEKLELIFRSFEQGDGSTARRYGGTGLGLAVTKQLVELHGGKLTVSSIQGEGSQFRFTLPLSPKDWQDPGGAIEPVVELSPQFPTAAALLSASSPSPRAEGSYPADASADKVMSGEDLASPNEALGRFKILIVDDEPVNLQVLVNHLSLEHYDIAQAGSGREALALLETETPPDLVLLDVMMPEMTGYEVCQEIRKRFPANELPVLMLTAKTQVADVVEGLKEGANDYLTKPIRKQELLARLRTHLYLANMSLAMNRFVPRQFLELLDKDSILDIEAGDQVRQQMSILFADIRDFTTLSERMTPEDNFRFINGYLSRMEPAITGNHGFIDKYIGDAIMALFDRSADDAVCAALAMFDCLAGYNAERVSQGYMKIAIGLGINTGTMMLGTVGGANRIDGTVIGDEVNVASRMEGLTKRYGVPLLISDRTLHALTAPEKFEIRRIDRVRVKGKSKYVDVYEVFDGDSPETRAAKRSCREGFEAAVVLFHRGEVREALAQFMDCVEDCPQDPVLQHHIGRCRLILAGNDDDLDSGSLLPVDGDDD